MKKIYLFDVDNTLLDHRTGAIPASALTAIDALRRAGHTIVVATGRSYGHAKPFIDLVAADFVITQNGALVLKGEDEVFAQPLARQPLVALFDWMDENGHPYGVNDGQSGYLSARVGCAMDALATVNMTFQNDDKFYLDTDAHQAWLFFDESLDATLMPEILRRFPDFGLVRWHRSAVDVMPAGVNKWTGCQWVMRATGFAAHQAIAFGDGLNDIEMLQGVGVGIAMDNGHPELKAVAQHIAPALHLDGIATMLEVLAHAEKLGPRLAAL